MTEFTKLGPEQLIEIKDRLRQRYQGLKNLNLTLDMTRGKPCPEQLDLSLDMLNCLSRKDFLSENGTDCRNYGGLDGIPEAKALFAEYMEVEPDELIIGGNSSLNLMHDTFMRAMIHGVTENSEPWGNLPAVKFLCPSPGYDRHFFICEYLGLEMITVDMTENGPNMDQVEDLVANDDSIKGIWCVPKYSNPDGVVYSDDVVERLAAMPVKAADFRIFWDNAYAVHHLGNSPAPLKSILTACKQAGNADRVFMYGSTSKISFAGSGVAVMAASAENMARTKKLMSAQTIGPDKLNQLRHVKLFKNLDGIKAIMQRHAAILRPKFNAVQDILEQELGGKNIAQWSKPDGGYFVNIDTLEGCAAKIISMAASAGVKLTPAGSTYPYKKDPNDRNIRIAPSFPGLDDIKAAMEVVGVCIQLVSLEKIEQK